MILSLYKRFEYYTFYIPPCEYLKIKKDTKILTNKMIRITMGIYIPVFTIPSSIKNYRKINIQSIYNVEMIHIIQQYFKWYICNENIIIFKLYTIQTRKRELTQSGTTTS